MRRLYKKYQLMLWLGLLLVAGGVGSSAMIYALGRDLLIDQGRSAAAAVRLLTLVSLLSAGLLTMLSLMLTWFWIARYHQHVRKLVSRDSMTGLLNRQSFTQTFQQASLEMQRLKLPLSLVLFDIDLLKKINEAQGHASGDNIIRELARLCQSSVRGSDILCRWSGEQFALLLKRCELDQAYKIAEQLRLNVQGHSFTHKNRQAPVTISLGVAQWTESESMDELTIRADEAVFLAKSEGRNRAEISYFVHQKSD